MTLTFYDPFDKLSLIPKIKKISEEKAKSKTDDQQKRVHPWRICLAGEHYRRATTVVPHIREGSPVSGGPRSWTCAKNPSGKDQLYPEEIQEIAKVYFGELNPKSLGTIVEFGENGQKFDSLILGWTQYWNEVLNPKEPLDPKLIKALIASESSFDPNAWNKRRGGERARGLMQVLDKTLPLLVDDAKELRNHFLNLKEDDILDPNLSICAGIRWMFRKKELAKKGTSWRDVVAGFKGIKPTNKRLMGKFDSYYNELLGNIKK